MEKLRGADGGLIGGASLKPEQFVEIINAAIEAAKTKYDSVTEQQRQRMENQFEIWNKALFVIDSY